MSDAAVGFGATDLFNLGANFKCQNSNSEETSEVLSFADANGHGAMLDNCNTTTRHKASYTYSGTDLATDLAINIAKVHNSILVDKVSIRCQAKQPATIDIEGHQHSNNAHAASVTPGDFDGYDMDLSALIGAAFAGKHIPATLPMANSADDAACIGLTLDFSAEHADVENEDGDHHFGRSHSGVLQVTEEFVGAPTLTTTGFTVESDTDADQNRDGDRNTVRARKWLAATTVSA